MSYTIKRQFKLPEDTSTRRFTSLRKAEPLISTSKFIKKAYKTYMPAPTKPYKPRPVKPYVPVPTKPYVPAPLRDYTPVPLKAYKPAPLKDYTTVPPKPYRPAPLKDYAPVPPKPYSPVPLKDYTPVPLKPYEPKPLKPYTPKPGGRKKGTKGELLGDGSLSEETCPYCGETIRLKTSGVVMKCHNCKNKVRYSPEV